MNQYEALKESISERLFEKEPLAASIMLYLNRTNPTAYKEILNIFDEWVSNRLDNMAQNVIDEGKSIE